MPRRQTLLARRSVLPPVSNVAYALPWSVTDDDRRRRQTPATVTSLPPTLCVAEPVITLLTGMRMYHVYKIQQV